MKVTMLVRVKAKEEARPDNGKHYVFPELPPGTQQKTLAVHPKARNADQLWQLTGDATYIPEKGIMTPLHQFATMPGVEKLTHASAKDVGKLWDPMFDLPAFMVNLIE